MFPLNGVGSLDPVRFSSRSVVLMDIARRAARAGEKSPVISGETFTTDKAALRLRLGLLAMLLDVTLLYASSSPLRSMPLPVEATMFQQPAVMSAIMLALGMTFKAYGFEASARSWASLRLAMMAVAATFGLLVLEAVPAIIADASLAARFVIAAASAAVFITLGRATVAGVSRILMPDGPTNKLLICEGTSRPAGRGELVIEVNRHDLSPALDDPTMLDRIGHFAKLADRIVVCCPAERRSEWAKALKGTGVDVEMLLPELTPLGALSLQEFGGVATGLVARGHLSSRDRVLKRALDLTVVIAFLPSLVLIGCLVAALIKRQDGGPVFFTQTRVGHGNRLFKLYKFRTMGVHALDANGTRSTTRDDDRVTRIGRLLRATSLDELPQFFNVLLGDMSVVGPRPHAIGSLAGGCPFWEIDGRYWHRHAAKPGLTGLAQVRGFRGSTTASADLVNRLQADLEYCINWSLRRDLTIILATFKVLVHRNAF